jgi:tRNA pseudouridine synthase 9
VLTHQISVDEAVEQAAIKESAFDTTGGVNSEHHYCPECYLPLHPDPNPEKLYIFLHALRYTTSLGEFSTDMPEWSEEGWTSNSS